MESGVDCRVCDLWRHTFARADGKRVTGPVTGRWWCAVPGCTSTLLSTGGPATGIWWCAAPGCAPISHHRTIGPATGLWRGAAPGTDHHDGPGDRPMVGHCSWKRVTAHTTYHGYRYSHHMDTRGHRNAASWRRRHVRASPCERASARRARRGSSSMPMCSRSKLPLATLRELQGDDEKVDRAARVRRSARAA